MDKANGVEFIRFLGTGETYAVDRSELSEASPDTGIDEQLINQLISGAGRTLADIDMIEAEALELMGASGGQAAPGANMDSNMLALESALASNVENPDELSII
jgi:hypothetical protein